jgi:hypothetical protein
MHTIDWGDGTVDVVTSGETYVSHEYETSDKYTCKIYGCTFIDDTCFVGCSNIETIEVSSTITEIGYAAFADCSELKTIKLAEGLGKIAESAFNNCSELREIQIPSSVVTIGDYAFNECSALAKVEILSEAISIGAGAFYGAGDPYSEFKIIFNSTTPIAYQDWFGDYLNAHHFLTIVVPKTAVDQYRQE